MFRNESFFCITGCTFLLYGLLYAHYVQLTIILRNRAEYHLIISRRGRRKSADIPQDRAG